MACHRLVCLKFVKQQYTFLLMYLSNFYVCLFVLFQNHNKVVKKKFVIVFIEFFYIREDLLTK